MLLNPELAATLRLIAEGGADAFYTGPIAHDIVAALRAVPGSPGDLAAGDLAGYAGEGARAGVRRAIAAIACAAWDRRARAR